MAHLERVQKGLTVTVCVPHALLGTAPAHEGFEFVSGTMKKYEGYALVRRTQVFGALQML